MHNNITFSSLSIQAQNVMDQSSWCLASSPHLQFIRKMKTYCLGTTWRKLGAIFLKKIEAVVGLVAQLSCCARNSRYENGEASWLSPDRIQYRITATYYAILFIHMNMTVCIAIVCQTACLHTRAAVTECNS